MEITSRPITDDWYVSGLNFMDEVKNNTKWHRKSYWPTVP